MLTSHLFWTFIILIVIGAVIGGTTNAIAIKMLFRPYYPRYIGKWRIPFTPGLIPKRRQELSEQLGEMVMSHLLTAEGIERKLQHPDFIGHINHWLVELIQDYTEQRIPIKYYIDRFADVEMLSEKLTDKTGQWIEELIYQWLETNDDRSLESLMSSETQEKIVVITPKLTDYIINNLVNYLESPEGKAQLKEQVDGFLTGRGMFGNMLQFFLGNQSLIDKLHPELLKFIQRSEFKLIVTELLNNEWEKLKKRRISELTEFIDLQNVVMQVKKIILPQLPYSSWMDKTIDDILGTKREAIIETNVPKITDLFTGMLANKINDILTALHLEDVVKQEVDTFSVQRLEEIVLMISKREFKMITYLGALLGAIIGLFQGIVLVFIG